MNGDENMPNYMAVYGDITSTGSGTGTYVGSVQGNGMSVANLRKLGRSLHMDPGRVPVLTLDLRSIPAAGESGSTNVTVSLYDGSDTTRDSGERVLSTTAAINWSSDGSTVSMTIPEQRLVPVTYITGSGLAVEGRLSLIHI